MIKILLNTVKKFASIFARGTYQKISKRPTTFESHHLLAVLFTCYSYYFWLFMSIILGDKPLKHIVERSWLKICQFHICFFFCIINMCSYQPETDIWLNRLALCLPCTCLLCKCSHLTPPILQQFWSFLKFSAK